jgi:hypothetical protein
MITAARLIGHKSINGKYQTKMAMDQFPILGHQMTHSIDTFITDSANSASALYSGHKSTVNCLGVYADSSEDVFDDPKVCFNHPQHVLSIILTGPRLRLSLNYSTDTSAVPLASSAPHISLMLRLRASPRTHVTVASMAQ